MGQPKTNSVNLFGFRQNWDMGVCKTDSLVTLVGCRGASDFQEIASAVKYAVTVKNAEYCHNGSKQKVLNGLNMTVPQGSIYGLTGSSGCGKTTLISCILGTRKVDAGEIFLYGHKMTSPSRQKFIDIPGKDIGYMPQELSLYSKFTILEILVYFGRLYGMSAYDIVESCQNLLDLLKLTRKSALIEVLSGGEKRRVSFAVSLIHSPKLLVLDEPTVGMDPLLRIRIWNHLRSLVKENQVTVIITSHYLDEMRRAHKIGVMRNGQIIVESTPQALLSRNAGSLDDVVLKICKNPDLVNIEKQVDNDKVQISYQDVSGKHNSSFGNLRSKMLRTRALIEKNLVLVLRNIPLLLFITLIPASQLLICLFMGYEPTGLRLGVVNKELNLSSSVTFPGNGTPSSVQYCPEYTSDSLNKCELQLLGCRFIHHISKRKVSLEYFASEEHATAAVVMGSVYGYVTFADSFSRSLTDRAFSQIENGNLSLEVFDFSRINARFDEANTIIYRLILAELYRAQEVFLTSLMSVCGANPQWGEYPLQFQNPVFGLANDFSFSEYVSPGATIPFMFFFAIISSGIRFIDERDSGALNRLFISGVQLSEILAAYLVSEFLLIITQAFFMYLLLSLWLPINSTDGLAAAFAFLLMLLSGYTGVSLGFLVGSLCTEQVQVAIFAIAFILPNIILSGIIWPTEAMPYLLQIIVKCLPCTLPAKAMRAIWSRGLDIAHQHVWPAIIVLLMYILILNLLTLAYKKFSRK